MLGHANEQAQLETEIRYVVRRLRALNSDKPKDTLRAREEHCKLLRNFEELLEVKVRQGREARAVLRPPMGS